MSKLEILERIIKEHISEADCGLFFTRNTVGDSMSTIYADDGLTVDICRDYMYLEVFGLTETEKVYITNYYESLKKDFRDRYNEEAKTLEKALDNLSNDNGLSVKVSFTKSATSMFMGRADLKDEILWALDDMLSDRPDDIPERLRNLLQVKGVYAMAEFIQFIDDDLTSEVSEYDCGNAIIRFTIPVEFVLPFTFSNVDLIKAKSASDKIWAFQETDLARNLLNPDQIVTLDRARILLAEIGSMGKEVEA